MHSNDGESSDDALGDESGAEPASKGDQRPERVVAGVAGGG